MTRYNAYINTIRSLINNLSRLLKCRFNICCYLLLVGTGILELLGCLALAIRFKLTTFNIYHNKIKKFLIYEILFMLKRC